MSESQPVLIDAALTGQHGEQENIRHAGNFLTQHDLRMHRRYRELLTQWLPSFIYASEEDEPQVVGSEPGPDLVVLVDPLDTSELAVRALHGYTHLLVYSRRLRRPVAAVVGDIFHQLRLYTAVLDADGSDRAYVTTRDGHRRPLTVRPCNHLADAVITNYSMRPQERFLPLARQRRLLNSLAAPDGAGAKRGRIGVDFGSIGLCHVAAGQTDGMIEFAKGFAAWDLLPGHYVLHTAGGTAPSRTRNTKSTNEPGRFPSAASLLDGPLAQHRSRQSVRTAKVKACQAFSGPDWFPLSTGGFR
jgi:myo-inositol-1(or 4)-monophosphatase